MARKFNLILAVSENNGIGYKGNLPWRLSKELNYFGRMTRGTTDPTKQNAVIMGRRTWESMPDSMKPLAGRLNIVLSSNAMVLKNGAIHCFNIDEVMHFLNTLPFKDNIETAWIIGGAKLYETVIKDDLCHRIYLTKVRKEFPCDVFVNLDLDNGQFKEVSDPRVPKDIQEENGITYTYHVYEKV